MAIARGAGTEIIRSAHFVDCNADTNTKLIIGVQHHIYTVLSVIALCRSVATDRNQFRLKFTGWDADNAASGVDIFIARQDMSADETFVWNDKFSFNGYEPDWSSPSSGQMTTAAEQDAISDQGGSVSQYLWADAEAATDSFDIMVTFIDQNNA